MATITLIPNVQAGTTRGSTDVVATLQELDGWLRSGSLAHHICRYETARYVTSNLSVTPPRFKVAVALRLLARKRPWFEDQRGARLDVTIGFLLRGLLRWGRDLVASRRLLRRIQDDVRQLTAEAEAQHRPRRVAPGSPVYLRTDFIYELNAGGSVAHTAGVLNSLNDLDPGVLFLTTGDVPGVDSGVDTRHVAPENRYWDFNELSRLHFNFTFNRAVAIALAGKPASYVYQRYSANNYSGVIAATERGIPLVLEYNGSELWVARHWGGKLPYIDLAECIENLNLTAADLIVVVSDPLREELVQRGIEEHKIVVIPNGVDVDAYSPEVDGAEVRDRFGFTDKVVIGFIGTFGPWHGSQVLAQAYGRLVEAIGTEEIHLLMIGDGALADETRAILGRAGIDPSRFTFTGIVSQERGPSHLAACDILVSPHVPNPDGSRFFGSPTKLFEYMAMGKAIVASDLEQIGEVLDHGSTALLVPPNDVDALAAALARLVGDEPLRERLGHGARLAAVERHTWKRHTSTILDALRDRCG